MAILLAAASTDSVRILDPAGGDVDESAPGCFSSPGFPVSCVRWNHTNMVVAIAGEDRKLSLWSPKLKSVTSIQVDNLEETINCLNFSHKSSRYLCSGGSSKVVRIWDMQKRKCIKWLKGHVESITDAAYNCRDEQVGSISVRGDLIIHSLASGSRVADLKDPHKQVLRVLDFSGMNRHLIATSGDDGSVHVWDTTGRNPKISWIKQHLAPTSAVCFSPRNDKIVISVGLDKKLYIYDTGVKRPVYCTSWETWYTSATFKDDGTTLAAGTSNGRIVLYDVRSKPQPSSVIRCFPPSKSVTSLSFQRSNPSLVTEKKLTFEMALLGPGGDEPVIMPDPLPSSRATNPEVTYFKSITENSRPPTGEETPVSSRLRTLIDDMEVFSPLVEVQPFISSTIKQFDFMSESERVLETSSFQSQPSPGVSTPPPLVVDHERSPSITPPEAWGGEGFLPPRFTPLRPSRFATGISTGISSASASYSGYLKKDALTNEISPSPNRATDSPLSVSADQDGNYYPALEQFHSPLSDNRETDVLENGTSTPAKNNEASHNNNYFPLEQQGPPNFALQLVQHALEESLNGVQRSIHEDVHNLHLELLRQFHIQQRGMEEMIQRVLKKQAELMEQIQMLRKENQELRQYL